MARAIERQLNLISAQSLLQAESEFAPSRSATDSGSVEGKREYNETKSYLTFSAAFLVADSTFVT